MASGTEPQEVSAALWNCLERPNFESIFLERMTAVCEAAGSLTRQLQKIN